MHELDGFRFGETAKLINGRLFQTILIFLVFILRFNVHIYKEYKDQRDSVIQADLAKKINLARRHIWSSDIEYSISSSWSLTFSALRKWTNSSANKNRISWQSSKIGRVEGLGFDKMAYRNLEHRPRQHRTRIRLPKSEERKS